MDKVDWSRPIEAVHKDGRVIAAFYVGGYTGVPVLDVESVGDGLTKAQLEVLGWRIRNVETATPAPKYPEALVEEAFTVLRETDRWFAPKAYGPDHPASMARNVLAKLPAEVDEDEEWAEAKLAEQGWRPEDGAPGRAAVRQLMAMARRDGRALERQHAGEGRGKA